ncbi:gliding motility-associated C-terminal domain-containing protein [Mucilaginibacter sp. Bleaf8]|uniref:CshA/CshB family fibrillar adhesin-related protein n=1 Tax=Mucilaginibacter sp. Bleaf8 TaxID=2834430 RepID=UPI001BCD3733|nr:CshA/CshB family fibrillar adhesin-related protein [Mucilaginibacter sp. Bleaf8]MBS7564431.1 gliding motility-associated C-terminal domain-containing protein [Mucilaginibacter sp. Bleaf8]
MFNNYLLKVALLFVLFCHVFTKASAQYAISGSAGPNTYNSVYWLTWDPAAPNSTLISSPTGADASHIINGTYTWQFSPTVRISATISNEVFSSGGYMTSYTPGDYYADGLNLIYSGNGLPGTDSRGVRASGMSTSYGGTVNFDIAITVSILINNQWTEVDYPGMIIADAESIDVGGEYITGTTPNPISWQLLNKRTQNNGADEHYKMDLTNSGKTFKLYADSLPGNFGVQAVMFAHGAHRLTNVGMKGSGITAMAIGFVLPFDLGDDPATYGVAGNYINDFEITDYFAGDGTYAVVNYDTTRLVPKANVYIGANNVDPDGQPVNVVNADSDEKVNNNDENTITPSARPDIRVNQVGDVVLSIPATNNRNIPATLHTWVDFNSDGRFTPDERLQITVPANTVNRTFTLTYPNASFASKIRVGPLYVRLRITTTNLTDDTSTPADERSTSFAADGETEDYRFKDILGITISGAVVNDGNGAADNAIAGNGLQSVGNAQLFAYLIDNATGTVVAKDTVGTNGTYSFTNTNNGNYTVAVSTSSVDTGSPLSAVAANLPAGWQPSGAAYGTNNAGHTGIQPGTPNLQVQVSTPGTSLDISNVNLGINQAPVAVADTAVTGIAQPVTINVPSNDSDADGQLNPGSVLLIDPADNTRKTSVTIAGQGTYTVNTTNGRVTFTPIAAFTGNTTPIAYTIKDNLGSESPAALISVTINPLGVNDEGVTPINTPITTNVKANDGSGAANNTVTPTNGAHGTTTVDANGNVIYTPQNGFIGLDTYTYTLTTPDGLVSAPITVTIRVKPVGVNDTDITPVNTPVTTTVKSNDGPSGINTTVTPTNGANGSTTVNPDGTVTYTPNPGYVGTDTYTYTLTTPDGIVSDPITVNVTIYSAAIRLTKVANNTVNKAGDVINYTLVVTNTGGVTLTNLVVTDAGADAGSISPASIASLAPGANTAVTARHTVTQADVTAGSFSNQATVTGTDPKGTQVTARSDDPSTLAANDPTVVTISPLPAGAIRITKTGVLNSFFITYTFVITNTGNSALNNVLFTDTKLGQTNTSVDVPAGGLLPGNSVTITRTYTLTQPDRDAGSVSNTASVTAIDAAGNTVTNSATTTTAVAKAPIATNDVGYSGNNQPVAISVLTNDSGAGTALDPTTIEVMTQPEHGTAVANSNGTVVYTPNPGYTGPDTFTYRVKDLNGIYTNVATVTVNSNATALFNIPTLFTPNGDGANDTFEIRGLTQYSQNELVIVNRWGNEVYHQSGYQNNWTGEGLKEGTYYYLLKVKINDNWQVFKGYITLIRTFKN